MFIGVHTVDGRTEPQTGEAASRDVEEWQSRQDAFRQAVMRVLKTGSLKLCRPIGLFSTTDSVAINEWDLRFKVAEQCPPELRDSYCSSLDGGQSVARSERLLEALRSTGRAAERVKSRTGAFFILVARDLVHTEPRDIVQLAAGSAAS